LEDLDIVPLSGGMKRAMKETRKALEDLGYEVVDFKISNEEFLEIRALLFVILSHFLMIPSI